MGGDSHGCETNSKAVSTVIVLITELGVLINRLGSRVPGVVLDTFRTSETIFLAIDYRIYSTWR